jgi:hypothetical protein
MDRVARTLRVAGIAIDVVTTFVPGSVGPSLELTEVFVSPDDVPLALAVVALIDG